jgi:ATP-dependent Clp protease adaptor protein ClpS
MVLEKTHRLILKNDNEHDFMYVIASLIKFCNHERNQAEQCAIITHNNGKCDISSGDIIDMMELQK